MAPKKRKLGLDKIANTVRRAAGVPSLASIAGAALRQGALAGIGSPSIGGTDPVEEALRNMLAVMPTSVGDVSGPFREAEGRAHTAYNTALPVIAAAYDDLRGKLGAGQQAYGAASQSHAAQRGADFTRDLGNINNLQSSAINDMVAQAGGNPTLGAGTSAAQVMAQQNAANMSSQKANEDARVADFQRAMEGQFADRRSGADQMHAAAASAARGNLNQILGQIGIARSNAERQAQSQNAELAQQRANIMLRMAEYQAERQERANRGPRPEDILKQMDLEDRLSEREAKKLGTGIDFVLGLERTNPQSSSYLSTVISGAEGLADVLRAIDADAKKGGGKVKWEGKKLDPRALKNWAREADRRDRASGGK